MNNQNLLSDQGLRLDGRKPNEIRKIKCKLGVFSQPDGSAYLEQGNTKVLVAVYGPHQVSAKKNNIYDTLIINCQYSMATFSAGERKDRPRGGRKSQEMTLHLQQTVKAAINTDLYPHSQIDIYLEILQADGGNYCASVNAITLALIDAGICLKEYVCACTASLVNNTALSDVSNLEEIYGGPTLSVASLPNSNKIAFIEMSQRFHLDHLSKVINQALEGCQEVRDILDKAVREHLTSLGSASGWANVAK